MCEFARAHASVWIYLGKRCSRWQHCYIRMQVCPKGPAFWPEVFFTFRTWEVFLLGCGMSTDCWTSLYFQMYFCLWKWHEENSIANYPVMGSVSNCFFPLRTYSYSDLERNGLLVVLGVFLFAIYFSSLFIRGLDRPNIISKPCFSNNFILSLTNTLLVSYGPWDLKKTKT